MAAPAHRSLVIWVPDWPVVAAIREGVVPAQAEVPIAVVDKGVVLACSAAARAEGVRRGQRRRDAHSRCPQLVIVEADPVRDQRAFSPLVTRIEQQAPGVQVLTPGLCALRVRGPARYYGGEAAAAVALTSVLAEESPIDVRAGVADGPFTAEQAARWATDAEAAIFVVPAGESASFLAPLPVTLLGDPDVADLLARLGIQTLGNLATMPPERMRERFGPRGEWLQALAAGHDSREVVPRIPPPELEREIAFEPPLELAEQVAFGIRVAADEFIAGIGAVDLVCTELRVSVTGDGGERSSRVWAHPGSFDAAAVVDRVRWQLAENALRSAVAGVRLEPERVEPATDHVRTLFGSGAEERVHHALSRVQAMIGHRGVLTPEVGDGRWLTERQVLVPWGDVAPGRLGGRRAATPGKAVTTERRPATQGEAMTGKAMTPGKAGGAARRPRREQTSPAPWPGSLPDPLPATVFPEPLVVAVIDADGDMIAVDGRGEPTGDPVALVRDGQRRSIAQWAGPWPVVERGWDPVRARTAHRFQVVDANGTAWLLVCEAGAWHAEGRYD